MEEKALQEFGLTANESKVYLFLLGSGTSTISEIADKIAIHRVNIYDLLKRLTEKGLVSFVVEGRHKIFSATEPSFLLKSIMEKEDLLQKILPSLEARRRVAQSKNSVRVFQGKNGIKAILEDMLRQRRTISVYGAQGSFAKILPVYFKQFNRRRLKEKIRIKIIHSEKVRKWRQKNPIEFSSVRFLSEAYDSPSTTFVYGSKTAIIMWVFTPIGILIESKELSKSYQNFFDLLWKIARK